MRRLLLTLVTLSAMLIALSAAGYTERERSQCYRYNPEDSSLTVLFDNKLWRVYNLNRVQVRSVFNYWNGDSDHMQYDSVEDVWTCRIPRTRLRIPGTLGLPCFRFYVNGKTWLSASGRRFIPDGYSYKEYNLVILDTTMMDDINQRLYDASYLKTTAEFDLSTRRGREDISNFRRVPATTVLFRCFHPFIWNFGNFETEPVRIGENQRLAAEEGIKSVICLSGDETDKLNTHKLNGVIYQDTIPAFYAEAIDYGRVLYAGTQNGVTPGYDEVYYHPRDILFTQWLQEIVGFILSPATETPIAMHCRQGQDRTGVFSAVLAAVCGADWPEIVEDYMRSNLMYVRQYRHGDLLKHTFETLLGVEHLEDVEDFNGAVCDYLHQNGILSYSDQQALYERLNPSQGVLTDRKDAVKDVTDIETVYYNLQGIPVSEPAHGLYLRRRGTVVDRVVLP